MAKTAKLRPWTATEIRKLKGLAKKKVGAAKIARALKRTTRAVETRATSLVSRCTPDRIKGASLTGAHKNAATVERRARLVNAIARRRRWLHAIGSGSVHDVQQIPARPECSALQVNMTIPL